MSSNRTTSVRSSGGREGAARNCNAPRKRILVVDDDSAVREMLSRVLTHEGYQALAAADGGEALKICTVARPDLVLLDLNMPVKGGWDTFERLSREDPWLPIIIITARPNQLFTALGSGVGALLEKPLDFPRLIQTIEALFAEPAESRLARMAGTSAEFHYLPGRNPGVPAEQS